jgi:hypothetical protein
VLKKGGAERGLHHLIPRLGGEKSVRIKRRNRERVYFYSNPRWVAEVKESFRERVHFILSPDWLVPEVG